jgi:hypothetical protein
MIAEFSEYGREILSSNVTISSKKFSKERKKIKIIKQ